jgi:minor extracellular serine protease Vpr
MFEYNLFDNDSLFKENDKNKWELIVKYSGELNLLKQELDVGVEILSNNYAIITLEFDKITELIHRNEIEYVEKPKLLYKQQIESGACVNQVKQDKTLDVSGRGVLVSVIDSGIDYTHKDFRNFDGSTRIVNIWDQSKDGAPPIGFSKGTVFSEGLINSALLDENPFNIVPQQDLLGHGTAVTGIACGNGIASNGLNKGYAPNSTILIVKLDDRISNIGLRTTDFMRGIKYSYDVAKEINMPLVINISFGTHDGSHDGNSLFETYINDMADEWKSVIVVASGNDGSSSQHYSNNVVTGESLIVQFNVAYALKSFYISFWKLFVDKFDFEVIAPNGESIGIMNFLDTIKTFYFRNVIINIIITQPNHYNGNQEIYFSFKSEDKFITDGVWGIRVIGYDVVTGTFDAWLPGREAVSRNTFFLIPDTSTTLTIPSTSRKVITVGGYNANIDDVSDFSGKGNTRENVYSKPDIVASAVNVLSTNTSGSYSFYSGTSMAAPIVAGSCALIMEWGIIKNNSPFLYGQKIKSYLQLGASRDSYINYPHKYWGFGKLCLQSTFDNLLQFHYNTVLNSQSINNNDKFICLNKGITDECYQSILLYTSKLDVIFSKKKYIVHWEYLNDYYIIVYFYKSHVKEFILDTDLDLIIEEAISYIYPTM